jgi:hypothetical protein
MFPFVGFSHSCWSRLAEPVRAPDPLDNADTDVLGADKEAKPSRHALASPFCATKTSALATLVKGLLADYQCAAKCPLCWCAVTQHRQKVLARAILLARIG